MRSGRTAAERNFIGEIRQEFDAPSPSIQAGKKVPPEPPAQLGLDWALGKTARFAGTEALPTVIPHTGTKLGALARRKGLVCGVAEPNTHICTGSKTKGKSTLS